MVTPCMAAQLRCHGFSGERHLLKMRSHDPKVRDLVLGGTADRVVRRTRASVLVLHHSDCWDWS